MNFDLRIPLGLMFLIFGLILTGAGLWGDPAWTTKSLGLNLNLGWGLFQIVFGLAMALPALRRKE
ncbi:MAG: hypothetical protein SFU85_07105 [Candidatus Methylacidiphilales bacterium]|nr:hypothetical protein [Candidatus Methylacidiphilales bacterium]